MTLFKLHFIVIFMYTMIFQIVLFIIPYKYDRLERTPAEEKADKIRRAKARKKKQQRNKSQLGNEVNFSIVKHSNTAAFGNFKAGRLTVNLDKKAILMESKENYVGTESDLFSVNDVDDEDSA